MKPEADSSADHLLAREFFRKADHDIQSVLNNLNAQIIPHDVVCFHCQQAAEKYLKGFLAWHGVVYERTHDLGVLVEQCARVLDNFGGLGPEIELLTAYAVRVRYPSDMDDPGPEESHGAFESMTVICQRVKDSLSLD